MLKEIIINSLSDQTRVAISEDGKLVDFFVEYPENRRMVGDVYLGRVARVLPGIRAAFIDIGMKHDGFLHFSDIGERTKDFQQMIEDDDEVADNGPSRQPKMINGVPVLQKGERILVQITKEPVANKGVRVSSSISIPGRFCVLLPLDNKVGVSKKISDYRERRRLRAIARGILPKNCGLIVRTVARKQSEEAVREDLRNLLDKWNKIEEEAKNNDPPKLIHQDVSTTSSVIRDLFTPDVSKVFIDSRKLHREVREYIETVHPQLAKKVEHYKPNVPIFEAFKIEEKIKELFGRKVALKSGGYLMIEHTEAMWVIDVNSGKYAANKEQEMNSLKTDLEAAREIVRQLRLRDIGGLIVVDFIDLEQDRNRKKVYDELKKEFRRDRAKVSILPMSDFGLIEITRQRIRQNIMQAVKEVCPYCLGAGTLTKRSHILYDIEGFLKKHRQAGGPRSILLRCHPTVAMKLREGCFITTLTRLQMKYFSRIRIVEDNTLGMDQFRFIDRKTNEDLSDKPI